MIDKRIVTTNTKYALRVANRLAGGWTPEESIVMTP
jgi:hypothetical protein